MRHDSFTHCDPLGFIPWRNLTAQFLDGVRVVAAAHDELQSCVIPHAARLARHHVLLGAQVLASMLVLELAAVKLGEAFKVSAARVPVKEDTSVGLHCCASALCS